MKRIAVLITVALLLCGMARMTPEPAPSTNHDFSIDLYRTLAGGDGNLIFSPLSIRTPLAMIYCGAEGNTREQMQQSLHFSADLDAPQTPASLLKSAPIKSVDLADALWLQHDMPVESAFMQRINRLYASPLHKVDFAAAPDKQRITINNWAEKHTHGLIKELIAPGIINNMTRLVLTSAIHFKGSWAEAFDPRLSHQAPFNRLDGTQAEATFMFRDGETNFMQNDELKMVELPYTGERLTMLVLLPENFKSFESALTPAKLKTWRDQLVKQEILLSLPKFKLESSLDLKGTLTQLGMGDAFGSEADFSGVTGKSDLFISAVIHKALIDVNEEGTVAAAATAVVAQVKSIGPIKPSFRADKPFIYIILDQQSDTILFMGRMLHAANLKEQ